MNLLSPTQLREVEALSRHFRQGPASGDYGGQVARRAGGHTEFAERRAYAPGDETKSIDWLAYARTGQPVVKRFHTEETNALRLLLDCSASSGLGSPEKLGTLKRMAAAIGYLGLCAGARVSLITAPGPKGELTLLPYPERRGRGAASALFDEIERAGAGGRTAIGKWVTRLATASQRRSSLVLLSDFLDETPFVKTLAAASRRGQDLRLVQVLAPEELSPAEGGDATLSCAETGQELRLTLDAHAVSRYERRLFSWLGELAECARSHGQTYVRLRSDGDLSAAVRRFARGSIDLP